MAKAKLAQYLVNHGVKNADVEYMVGDIVGILRTLSFGELLVLLGFESKDKSYG